VFWRDLKTLMHVRIEIELRGNCGYGARVLGTGAWNDRTVRLPLGCVCCGEGPVPEAAAAQCIRRLKRACRRASWASAELRRLTPSRMEEVQAAGEREKTNGD
jgi:hypothetical protein